MRISICNCVLDFFAFIKHCWLNNILGATMTHFYPSTEKLPLSPICVSFTRAAQTSCPCTTSMLCVCVRTTGNDCCVVWALIGSTFLHWVVVVILILIDLWATEPNTAKAHSETLCVWAETGQRVYTHPHTHTMKRFNERFRMWIIFNKRIYALVYVILS